MKLARHAWFLIKDSFREWYADKSPRLGAALSYYTVFSLAPVLLVAISVAALVLGPEAAQGQVVAQLRGLLGDDGAGVVQGMLQRAHRQGGGVLGTVIGLFTLLVGATGVMVELQAALNAVWKVVPKPGRPVKTLIRSRLVALGLVMAIGFALLVSLALSAALAAVTEWLGGLLPEWFAIGFAVDVVVSLLVIAGFFALLFKVLPDAKVSWRDVWVGAFVTSGLFHLGKLGIGLYLGKAGVASSFGAAGSLAVLLVWVYYSAQILLFGAEFTRSYANHFGSRVVPDENALPRERAEPVAVAAEAEAEPIPSRGDASAKAERRLPH